MRMTVVNKSHVATLTH